MSDTGPCVCQPHTAACKQLLHRKTPLPRGQPGPKTAVCRWFVCQPCLTFLPSWVEHEEVEEVYTSPMTRTVAAGRAAAQLRGGWVWGWGCGTACQGLPPAATDSQNTSVHTYLLSFSLSRYLCIARCVSKQAKQEDKGDSTAEEHLYEKPRTLMVRRMARMGSRAPPGELLCF
jgi:hypothetical protein